MPFRCLLGMLFLVSSLQAQDVARLELVGLRGERRVITAADIAAMPRREVEASAHHVSGRFAGVPVREVLGRLTIPRGDSLRGKALATYVLVEAADGYRALFALPELDAAFTDRLVLLADRKNGEPLSSRDGPFQLVVPDEKRPARWVRQVRRIRVVQVPAEP